MDVEPGSDLPGGQRWVPPAQPGDGGRGPRRANVGPARSLVLAGLGWIVAIAVWALLVRQPERLAPSTFGLVMIGIGAVLYARERRLQRRVPGGLGPPH